MNIGSTDGSSPGGCAATLVATNWAVTAAHCIKGVNTDGSDASMTTLSVVLGEFDLSSSSDSNDGNR